MRRHATRNGFRPYTPALLALLGAAFPAAAAESPVPPEPALRIVHERFFEGESYVPRTDPIGVLPRIERLPRADGKSRVEFPAGVLHATGFFTRTGEPAAARTEFWAAHDGERLVLACRCQAVSREPDWSLNERVVFDVDPNGLGRYFQAVVPAAGDSPPIAYRGNHADAFPKVVPNWERTARLDGEKGEWIATLSIPLSDLGLAAGATLGVNVERRGVAGVPAHQVETYWAPNVSRGIDPGRFRRLTLQGSPIALLEAHPGELLPGENILTLRLKNTTSAPLACRVSATPIPGGATTPVAVDLGANEERIVEAPYALDATGFVQVAYGVEWNGGRIGSVAGGMSRAGSFLSLIREDVYPEIRDPERKTVLAAAERLQAYVRLDRSRTSLRDCVLKAEIRDAATRAMLAQHALGGLTRRGFVFSCDVSGLKPGGYVLGVSLAETNKPAIPLGEAPFRVAAPGTPGPTPAARVSLFYDNAVEGLEGDWTYAFGLLLPPHALYAPDRVRVTDRDGKPLPTQAREIMRWRPGGAIKLMQVLFQAPPPKEKTAVMRLLGRESNDRFAPFRVEYGTRVEPAPVDKPIRVREEGDSIVVDTGALRGTIGKRDGFFSLLELDANGNGTYEAGERVLGPGAAQALTAVDQNGTVYIGRALAGDAGTVIEQAGPVEVVLRTRGHYADKTGRSVSEYRMRLRFARQSRDIRIEHTWVMSGDANAIQFQDIAFDLPLAGLGPDRTVVLDTPDDPIGTPVYTERLGARSRLSLLQDLYHHHGRVGAHAGIYADPAGRGATVMRRTMARAGHWMEVQGAAGGVLAAIRDLWQQFPKELELDGDRLRLHLYSSRTVEQESPVRFGRRLLDFRNESWLAWWGDRFLRGVAGGELPGWTAMYQNARGIARTHELLLHWYGNADPETARRARGREFQTPVLTLVQPDHTCSADPHDQPQPLRYPVQAPAERFLAKLIEGQLWEEDRMGNYGFNEYGSYPHFYSESLTQMAGGGPVLYKRDERLQASMYRYAGHEYTLTTYLWWNYVRSGDRRYRDLVRRHVLHLLDRQIGHVDDGAGRYGEYCDYATPYFWADGALEQWSFFLDTAMWLSAFGGADWGLDVARECAEAYRRRAARRDWLDRVPLHEGSPLRPWYGILHEASALYSYFGDLEHACMAAELADRLINPESPSGVMPGAGKSAGQPQHSNVMLRPILRYFSVCGKNSVLQAARTLCANYAKSSYAMHGYTVNLAPYVWAQNVHLNGDRDILALARQNLETAPFGRSDLSLSGLVNLDWWRPIGPEWKGYLASVPFLMRALTDSADPGPYPLLEVREAHRDVDLWIDDPRDEPFRLVLSFQVETYPLRPDLPAGVDPGLVPMTLTGPSGKSCAAAVWTHEKLNYMGIPTLYTVLEMPADGEQGAYALRIAKQPYHAKIQFAVRSATTRKLVVGLHPLVELQGGPLYFHVPRGTREVRLGLAGPAWTFRDPAGRGGMPGRQGVTVPSHADDALWSLTRVSGGLDPVNVPPVAAFHTPSRFFLPPGLDKPTAAAETPAAAAAPQSRFPPGRFGRALRVDRTAPFLVQLDGPGAASQGPAGTIEFWLKPEATPDGRPAGALWRRFRAGRTTTGLYARNATLCLEGKDGNRSWPYYPYFGLTRLLEPERWQHVAVCWDFSKRWIALYVNGAGQAIAETWVKRLDADDWSAGFDAIGFLNVPGVSPLTGDLDEIRVSSAVRYPGGFVPAETPFEPDADTVLLLHLDGGLEVESGSESLVGKAGFAEGP